MTITEILKSDATASEKLTQLSEVVDTARKAYGNTKAEITVPEVNTADGMVKLTYLDADSKVALAERMVRCITIQAVETAESTEGAVLDREIERLIATDPILCSLMSKTDSKYI